MSQHFFKKGNQYAKGKGRPKMSKEMQLLKRKTRTDIGQMVLKYGNMNVEELDEIYNERTAPAFDMAVLAIMSKAIKDGDPTRLSWLLLQAFGEAKGAIPNSGEITKKLKLNDLSDDEVFALENIYKRNGLITDDSK